MPAVNFAEQFAGPVERGEKRQTIRLRRKDPIAQGDHLYLYTGMRTKRCRKLRDAECAAVEPIGIDHAGRIAVGGNYLGTAGEAALARADGFGTVQELVDWFVRHYGLPFAGVIIHW